MNRHEAGRDLVVESGKRGVPSGVLWPIAIAAGTISAAAPSPRARADARKFEG